MLIIIVHHPAKKCFGALVMTLTAKKCRSELLSVATAAACSHPFGALVMTLTAEKCRSEPLSVATAAACSHPFNAGLRFCFSLDPSAKISSSLLRFRFVVCCRCSSTPVALEGLAQTPETFFAGCCSHILPLRAQRKTFRKWRSHSIFLFLMSFPSLWSALPSLVKAERTSANHPF